jgi:hypothetical protein
VSSHEALVESRATILVLVGMVREARTRLERAVAAVARATRWLEERQHGVSRAVSWEWRERRHRAEARAAMVQARRAVEAREAGYRARLVSDACEAAVARYAEAVRCGGADAEMRRRLAARVVVHVERLTDGAIVLSLACGHAVTLEPLVGPINDYASCPACMRQRV